MSAETITRAKPCRCIRTKTMYGTFVGNAEDWETGVASTAAFWCMKTMGPAGPDEHFVHISQCGPTRSCYEPDED